MIAMRPMQRLRRLTAWSGKRRRAAATSIFADTTMVRDIWTRRQRSAARFGIAGAVVGVLAGLVAFAPATWLAHRVAEASGQRLLLTDARGTLWKGSAAVVFTGGPGSRDASMLPGRLAWTAAVKGAGLDIRLTQPCCIYGTQTLRVEPGIGKSTLVLPAAPSGFGQWPAGMLAGLGTPWNTLDLGGQMRLATPGAKVVWNQGRVRLDGQAVLDVQNLSSRVSQLDALGSYRLVLSGDPSLGEVTSVQLQTVAGPLNLSGLGQLRGNNLRFSGEATAAPGAEAPLNNLLNIIGRRQGARSVISIG